MTAPRGTTEHPCKVCGATVLIAGWTEDKPVICTRCRAIPHDRLLDVVAAVASAPAPLAEYDQCSMCGEIDRSTDGRVDDHDAAGCGWRMARELLGRSDG